MRIKAALTPDQRHALAPFQAKAEKLERKYRKAVEDLNRAATTLLGDQLGPGDRLDLATWTILTTDAELQPREAATDG
jgi:hypothetical protein